MKTILVTILTSLSISNSICAKALEYADILGTWKGARTEYFSGQRVTGTQAVRITRLAHGGFAARTTIFFPGIGSISGTGKYLGTGDYEGTLFYKGQAISSSFGSWRINGNTVRVRFKTQDISGSSRGNAQMRFVNSRTLISISSQSNGGRVSVTLHRR